MKTFCTIIVKFIASNYMSCETHIGIAFAAISQFSVQRTYMTTALVLGYYKRTELSAIIKEGDI